MTVCLSVRASQFTPVQGLKRSDSDIIGFYRSARFVTGLFFIESRLELAGVGTLPYAFEAPLMFFAFPLFET